MKKTIHLSCIDLIDLFDITGGCCDSCHDDGDSFGTLIETPGSKYSFDLSSCCSIINALEDMGIYKSGLRPTSTQYEANRYRRFKRLWLRHNKSRRQLLP